MRFFVFLALGSALFAQPKPFEFWPGTKYDQAVPTVQKVLGYESGTRMANHAQLVKYFEALAAAQPNRVKLVDYAKSWEGRKLFYAVIGNEANLKRLPEIQAGMKKLADPRKTPEAEAQKLIATLPAVIMLAYSVHGNEISTTDSAIQTAYHLLAARGDKMVDDIFAKTIVLIDPLQNPDGRERFVHNFEIAEGLEPDPYPLAAEHDEPYPGGRSNHYNFDMNRDWFALTQPETRGRIKLLLEWFPLVFADLHEMGGESTYYFAPEAVPFNPHIEKNQREALDLFGKNNAKHFDDFGFSYFTREVFDAFYPGYGASWPTFYGSVAMTYENASLRGLRYLRSDDVTLDYPQSVQKHFVASVSTAEAAATNREALLRNFWNYRKTAIEEGKTEQTKEYILPRRGDVSTVDKLAHLLGAQGIDVRQAKDNFTAGGAQYPAGSYSIVMAQPAKRFIRTMLDQQVPMEADFLKEQERRRKRKLRDEIYDVTGWSLPLQFNVECIAQTSVAQGSFAPLEAGKMPPGVISGGKATVAYVIPWGTSASAKLLAAMLREGIKVHSTDKAFTQAGRKFSAGTLLVKVKEHDATLADKMAKIVPPSGAEVIATGTGWVEDGVNFGSNYVSPIRKINIAMAYDTPVGANSAGHARWVLERQYGYPVTLIRASRLGIADLSRYHVLILPEGGYGTVLANATPRLKTWLANGGTLIGLGSAVNWLSDSKVGLLAIQQESLMRPGEAPKKVEPVDGRVPGKLLTKEEEYEKAIQADSESPDAIAGVLARVKVDPEHWINAGVAETVNVLISGRTIYTPIKLDKGINAAVFKGPEELLASGYLWEENRKQLAFKPFLVVQKEGRGNVIGFTADPNYRGYMDGLNLMFLNAVFRGPMHNRAGFGAAEANY